MQHLHCQTTAQHNLNPCPWALVFLVVETANWNSGTEWLDRSNSAAQLTRRSTLLGNIQWPAGVQAISYTMVECTLLVLTSLSLYLIHFIVHSVFEPGSREQVLDVWTAGETATCHC